MVYDACAPLGPPGQPPPSTSASGFDALPIFALIARQRQRLALYSFWIASLLSQCDDTRPPLNPVFRVGGMVRNSASSSAVTSPTKRVRRFSIAALAAMRPFLGDN